MIDRIEIDGQIEAQRKIAQVIRDLYGAPLLDAMRQATLGVTRDARKLAPVDVGRLRSSILPEVRRMNNVITGVVGSNVQYAAAMELGSRPHWPPIKALEVWAKRHGMNPYLVARAIARRGTAPRRYLQGAFEQNKPRIVRLFGDAVSRIVTQ